MANQRKRYTCPVTTSRQRIWTKSYKSSVVLVNQKKKNRIIKFTLIHWNCFPLSRSVSNNVQTFVSYTLSHLAVFIWTHWIFVSSQLQIEMLIFGAVCCLRYLPYCVRLVEMVRKTSILSWVFAAAFKPTAFINLSFFILSMTQRTLV